jgi:hypothetical protein
VKIESLISDTVTITIYFKECNGLQVISDFDTTLYYNNSWPAVPEEIQVISIRDTNFINTNCLLINQFDTLSIFNYSNQFLDISEKEISKIIKIFPNPVTNIVQIEVSEEVQLDGIELFDMSGKKVKTYNSFDRNLNISGLSSGTYFLKLLTQEGILTKKVIIE